MVATAVLLVAPLLGALLIGPSLMRAYGPSRVDVACAQIHQLARLGHSGWHARRVHDPWGTPYRAVHVGDRTVWVSAGPDRVFGTADDLTGGRR